MSLLQKAIGNMMGSQNERPQPSQPGQFSMEQAMRELRQNPAEMIKKAGFNVPQEYANNPQSAVMYLIQTGQVRGSMLNHLMGSR